MPEISQKPSFSVIIGCYNHNTFIQETVSSVLSQTYAAKELIVVDDASPDGSAQTLKALGGSIIPVLLTKNGGGSAARNAGAVKATGDYLVFLDGDDALASWALELYAVLAARERPAIILASLFFFGGPTVATSDIFWKGPDKVVNYDGRAENIVFVNYGTLENKDRTFRSSGSSMVMERDAFWKAGGWTEQIFPGEDTDLQLKMLYDKSALHILAPPTAYYRMHDGNTMKQVRRFTEGLQKVMRNAKAGAYSGTQRRKREAYSLLGGEVWFWVRRAGQVGEYKLAAQLFFYGFMMIAAGGIRRVQSRLHGRRKAEILSPLAGGASAQGSRSPPRPQK
jgi:glycosyltransferase involved in cell wall biosynthesis